MNYFATFFTHSAAIKFARFLTKNSIESESSPVPRKISSNCGIGVRFCYTGNLDKLYIDDMEKIYLLNNNTYTLIQDFDE